MNSTDVAYLILAQGSILGVPEFFSEEKLLKFLRLINAAGYGKVGLKNVDRTHLVLASGKLVLQEIRIGMTPAGSEP